MISVKVPVIYKSNFARRVIEMYGEAMPYLLKLFRSVKVEEVKVEFYLPGRTITTLGYVTTEDISRVGRDWFLLIKTFLPERPIRDWMTAISSVPSQVKR